MLGHGHGVGLTALATCALFSIAGAQPRPAVPDLVGATEVVKLTAPDGFIDDAIAFDDQRLAYVATDGSTKAELHVVTLANERDATVDITAITLHPLALRLLGARAFVVGQAEDGSETGTLFELAPAAKKPVVYKLGPATHVSVITRDGRPRVVVYRATPLPDGTRHEVELHALETGARLGVGHLDLDAKDANKQLDLRVNHWADGMTRAFGIKGGAWDPKENQRTPDVEAAYDVVTGKLERTPITDLFEQHKRFEVLAKAGGRLDFVRMAWDNQSVQLWRAGKPTTLVLDQALSQYDPKSLQGEIEPDGTAWLALKVDPVNPDAVARKKADPEYLDIFRVGADGKAVRKARVLATGVHHKLGVIRGKFWLLERSSGFDRGGKTLTVYGDGVH